MGLFICDKCGCIENTATGFYWTRNHYLWADESLNGLKLCSACAPDRFKDGSPSGYGKWHGKFPREYAGDFSAKELKEKFGLTIAQKKMKTVTVETIESPDIVRERERQQKLADSSDTLRKAYTGLIDWLYSNEPRAGEFATQWELNIMTRKMSNEVDGRTCLDFVREHNLPKWPSIIRDNYSKDEALKLITQLT